MPTEILRPNGAGDAPTGTWVDYPAAGDPWDKIDEASPDDDTTYIYTSDTTSAAWRYYYAALQATALTTETVDSVDCTIRLKLDNGEDYVAASGGVRLGGNNSLGATRYDNGFTWTNYTDSGLAKPTGGGWAVSDLDALQAVVALYYDADWSQGMCTQTFVTVNYTSAGGGGGNPWYAYGQQ